MSALPNAPRLLFLLTELCARGGIQRFNQTLLSACAELGIRGDVLTLQDCREDIDGATVPPTMNVHGCAGNRASFVLRTAQALGGNRYDWVVVGHINFLRFVTLLHRVLPVARAPLALVAHGIEVWTGIGPRRRSALQRIDKVLCVSRYTRQRIHEQAPRLPAGRLEVFPNALARSFHDEFTDASLPDLPGRFLLSVTRLERGDRYKGIVTTMEALSMLEADDVHYCVVGRGDDLEFLRRVAARLGVSQRVHFLQDVEDAGLVELYRRCTAFVLPSGKEGFGIVFLEAMFFGAPVIAAAERGALDVIEDGRTGLLVRYGDVAALTMAIGRILREPSLPDRLRHAARANVAGDGPFTYASFRRRCGRAFGAGSLA